MATHSSVLAWRITGTGGLPSLGSHRVGHDWSDLAAAAAGVSLIAQLVKNPPAMKETPVQFLGWEDPPGEGIGYPSQVFGGFLCGSTGKESICNVGDLGLIPGIGRSPGEGNGYPLQYSGLENSMDCIDHGVAKSRTWLSNFHLTSLSIWVNIRKIGK